MTVQPIRLIGAPVPRTRPLLVNRLAERTREAALAANPLPETAGH